MNPTTTNSTVALVTNTMFARQFKLIYTRGNTTGFKITEKCQDVYTLIEQYILPSSTLSRKQFPYNIYNILLFLPEDFQHPNPNRSKASFITFTIVMRKLDQSNV